MRFVPYFLASAILVAALPACGAEPARGNGIEFFEKKIRPVLVERCYACHSAQSGKSKGGLTLDTRAGLLQGGDSGPALVPGKAGQSLLLNALRHDGLKMPPKEPLAAAVVADFQAWIEMGAPDPRVAATPSKPVAEEASRLWSLQPLRRMDAPVVKYAAWPRGEVDRFLLAKLEAAGLTPAADADLRTLIRRVTFDLTGLPPTPEEVDAFERSALRAPQAAFAAVVDRLLASPAFGERWGRHWLDLARYGESSGKNINIIQPHAWRYRDYVIASFNADKPFDDFVREQIAGDLLPADTPARRDEMRVATGFLVLGPKSFEEGASVEKFLLEQADEQIDVLSRAVLGMTISCARCHDHKFDPVSTRDYYALAGIFLSTETLYGPGAKHNGHKMYGTPLQPLGPDGDKLHGPSQEHEDRLRAKNAELGSARSGRYRHVRNKESFLNQKKAQAADEKKARDLDDKIKVEEAKIAEWDAKIAAMVQEIAAMEKARPPAPDYAMATREGKIDDCAVRVRGEWNRKGPLVPRGFPAALGGGTSVRIGPKESGRLSLAGWLTAPENPLTARVAVNRVWKHLFGEGLVRTVDNFGANGELPTHPELLDHLALGFRDDGWSVKRLIRRLVLSRAYQLALDRNQKALATDPDNRLWGRRTYRRLEAEAVRDALLSVSGRLERTPPAGSRITTAKVNSAQSLDQPPAGEGDRPCRTVYLTVSRSMLPEMLPLFDFADPSLVIGRRDERTMPAQALFLMNSPFVQEQARSAADRLLAANDGDDRARLDRAYALCFARPAHADERRQALAFLHEFGGSPAEGWAALCQALFASAEFRYVE